MTTRLRSKPEEISELRWGTIVANLTSLLTDQKRHLIEIINYGWPVKAVFGCHSLHPDTRLDGMGLLLLMRPTALIKEVNPTSCSFKHGVDGREVTYDFRKIAPVPFDSYSTLMEIK